MSFVVCTLYHVCMFEFNNSNYLLGRKDVKYFYRNYSVSNSKVNLLADQY